MKTIDRKQQKMKLQPQKNQKMEKCAMELISCAQIGVKAPSFNLHMARVGEVPY